MAAAMRYNESAFQAQLDKAIQELKKTVHNTKRPVAPAQQAHTYDDKFQIANLETQPHTATWCACSSCATAIAALCCHACKHSMRPLKGESPPTLPAA